MRLDHIETGKTVAVASVDIAYIPNPENYDLVIDEKTLLCSPAIGRTHYIKNATQEAWGYSGTFDFIVFSKGGSSGTDVKLDVNPSNSFFDNVTNQLKLSNTDGTFVVADFTSISTKAEKTYVDLNFTSLGAAITEKADRNGLARVRYTLPNLASNTSGTNIFASTEIIDFEERVEIVKVGTGENTLYNLPKPESELENLVQYSVEINFKGTISSTDDADDLVRFELWNGTNPTPLKSRSITRSQLNDSVFPSGGVVLPFYTRGMDDPMTLTDADGKPTGGFKILVFNRTGATINTPQLDVRIQKI
jgi:hypothetical protein